MFSNSSPLTYFVNINCIVSEHKLDTIISSASTHEHKQAGNIRSLQITSYFQLQLTGCFRPVINVQRLNDLLHVDRNDLVPGAGSVPQKSNVVFLLTHLDADLFAVSTTSGYCCLLLQSSPCGMKTQLSSYLAACCANQMICS